MVECHMGRAYNKGMDKDTEDIHKLHMNQAGQKQVNLRLPMRG